tara:strand:+ start:94 stop:414 length:321 start_codon:yes stop_codon:yes gene_type:complete
MNSFDDRKKGFEAKYKQDQEAQFKIRALRNKLVGEWAATLVKPTDIENYIKEVRISDLEKPGDDDLIDKLIVDFESINLNIEREEIIKKISQCEESAIQIFIKDQQ